jgi:hypothetical protein
VTVPHPSYNSALQPTPTRATWVVVCYSFACGLVRLSPDPLDDAMNDFELRWLVGDRLRAASPDELGAWNFAFVSGGGIAAECPWRSLQHGTIVLSSADHHQRYGLPATVDAAAELALVVADRRIQGATIIEGTADLHITFDAAYELQIVPFSSGYESWRASSPDGFQLIAQGGGQLAGFNPLDRVV